MGTQTSAPSGRPVRQATLLSASWSEPRGVFELTLRDDAGEYVLQAASEDADALFESLKRSRPLRFDVEPRAAASRSRATSARPVPLASWAEASRMQT